MKTESKGEGTDERSKKKTRNKKDIVDKQR